MARTCAAGQFGLPRRPAHGATAQHVNMQMVDSLTAMLAGVDHSTKPLRQPLGGRKFSRDSQQMPQQSGMFACGVRERHKMATWDHKKMRGCLGRNVAKGECLDILVQRLDRQLPGGDPAKKAIHTAQHTVCTRRTAVSRDRLTPKTEQGMMVSRSKRPHRTTGNVPAVLADLIG